MENNDRRWVYLDNSATTPVKQEVLDAMTPYFTQTFGNASSIHSYGQIAKEAVDTARKTIADTLNTTPETIYFTSGGTEADNWAIKGVFQANARKGNHIITSAIEHHAVLHVVERLAKEGAEITVLPVDEYGRIRLEELEAAITDQTILVSIMTINNEIGTRHDIKAISEICHKHGVLFHTDAVQAYGNMTIDVKDMGIDLMSFSAHKIYGPKGVGALYIKKGVRIANLVDGGAQERKKRPGTLNVPGIVGFAKAAEVAYRDLDQHITHVMKIRDHVIRRVLDEVPDSRLNGHPTERHPGNIHLCFHYIEGEALLLSLDAFGVEGSSGSACTSGSLDPSHVLMGIGLTHEIAHGSIRLTVGDFTKEEDGDYIVEAIKAVVKNLRQMSPLYDEKRGK